MPSINAFGQTHGGGWAEEPKQPLDGFDITQLTNSSGRKARNRDLADSDASRSSPEDRHPQNSAEKVEADDVAIPVKTAWRESPSSRLASVRARSKRSKKAPPSTGRSGHSDSRSLQRMKRQYELMLQQQEEQFEQQQNLVRSLQRMVKQQPNDDGDARPQDVPVAEVIETDAGPATAHQPPMGTNQLLTQMPPIVPMQKYESPNQISPKTRSQERKSARKGKDHKLKKLAMRLHRKSIYQFIQQLKDTARQVDQQQQRSRIFRFSDLQDRSPPGGREQEAYALNDLLDLPEQNEEQSEEQRNRDLAAQSEAQPIGPRGNVSKQFSIDVGSFPHAQSNGQSDFAIPMSFRPDEKGQASNTGRLVSDISFTSLDRKKESGELEQNQMSRASPRQSVQQVDDDRNDGRPSAQEERSVAHDLVHDNEEQEDLWAIESANMPAVHEAVAENHTPDIEEVPPSASSVRRSQSSRNQNVEGRAATMHSSKSDIPEQKWTGQFSNQSDDQDDNRSPEREGSGCQQSPAAVECGPEPMLETPKVVEDDEILVCKQSLQADQQIQESVLNMAPDLEVHSSESPQMNAHERLEQMNHEKGRIGRASILSDQQVDFDLTIVKRDSSFISGIRDNNKLSFQQNPQKNQSQQIDGGQAQEKGATAMQGKLWRSDKADQLYPPKISHFEQLMVKAGAAKTGVDGPHHLSFSLSPSPAARRKPSKSRRPKAASGFAQYMGASARSRSTGSQELAPAQPPLIQVSNVESTFKEEAIAALKNLAEPTSAEKDEMRGTDGRGPLADLDQAPVDPRDTQMAHAIIGDLAAEARQEIAAEEQAEGSPDPLGRSKKRKRRRRKSALGITTTQGSRTSRSQPKKKKKRRVKPLDRCEAEISPALLEEIDREIAATTEYDSPQNKGKAKAMEEDEESHGSQDHKMTRKAGLDGDFADLNDRVELLDENGKPKSSSFMQSFQQSNKYTLPLSHSFRLQPQHLAALKNRHPWIKLPPEVTIDSELKLRADHPSQAMQLTLKVNKLCPLRTFFINDASFVENKTEDKTVKFFDNTVQEFLQNGIDNRSEFNMDRLRMGVIMRDFKDFAEKLAEKMAKVLSVKKKINGGLKYDLDGDEKQRSELYQQIFELQKAPDGKMRLEEVPFSLEKLKEIKQRPQRMMHTPGASAHKPEKAPEKDEREPEATPAADEEERVDLEPFSSEQQRMTLFLTSNSKLAASLRSLAISQDDTDVGQNNFNRSTPMKLPETITKTIGLIQSWKNYQRCLKGIKYSFQLAEMKYKRQKTQIIQRIVKNLEVPSIDGCRENLTFKYCLVSLFKLAYKSKRLEDEYCIEIQDRLDLKKTYNLMLPIMPDVHSLDKSAFLRLERNLVKFVRNEVRLNEEGALQLLSKEQKKNGELNDNQLFEKFKVYSIEQDFAGEFCQIDVHFLGKPFQKWQVTIKVQDRLVLTFTIEIDELLEINECHRQIHEIKQQLSLARQNANATSETVRQSKHSRKRVKQNAGNESRASKRSVISRASRVSKLSNSSSKRPPKAIHMTPQGSRASFKESASPAAERRSVSGVSSAAKLKGQHVHIKEAEPVSGTPSKKRKLKIRKSSSSKKAQQSGSPAKILTLTSKALRKFDRINKNFVGKDFTEKYMKNKVEHFIDKMQQDELEDRTKQRLAKEAEKQAAKEATENTMQTQILDKDYVATNLDKISEENSQSMLNLNVSANLSRRSDAAGVTLNDSADAAQSAEMNHIDIDAQERDLQYLQNAFNYHTNRSNFWKNCVIGMMSLTQNDIRVTLAQLNLNQELINQIYVPLPGFQDQESNYKIMQQKVDDIFLDWTLHAPYAELVTGKAPSKHILCRAYRNNDGTESADGVTPVILEIIPLTCMPAATSNFTSVAIDLDQADLVQMNLKMPQPTEAVGRRNCLTELHKYLYDQKSLLPVEIDSKRSTWWLAFEEVKDYLVAVRQTESYRVASLLGYNQPILERGRNDFKAERSRGTEKCDYQKFVKFGGRRMLLNLYVAKLSLKISIFEPTQPQIRPIVLNISPSVASITQRVPVESFLEKETLSPIHRRDVPHWRFTAGAANLALWPFLGALLRQNDLRGNKPILERICEQVQSLITLIDDSLPKEKIEWRPPIPTENREESKPDQSEAPIALVLEQTGLNMWHSLQGTQHFEQPQSALPLNINTDLHQVNQLSMHDNTTTNVTRKTVKRIVVRKKKVKKKKKRPKGGLQQTYDSSAVADEPSEMLPAKAALPPPRQEDKPSKQETGETRDDEQVPERA